MTVLEATRAAIAFHHDAAGFEPTDDEQTRIWHMLYSIIELCDAAGINFNDTLEDVKNDLMLHRS